jgi:hypothetical protein
LRPSPSGRAPAMLASNGFAANSINTAKNATITISVAIT